MKRIDKLTPEQEKAMPIYAKKWIDLGLKTGKTDWTTFEKFMPICYEKTGLKYPKNIVRVSSPMVGGLAAPIAEAIWKKCRGAVDGAVRDAVDGAVGGAVDGAVRDAVGDAVGSAVLDAVGSAVDGAVGGAVRGAVGGAVDGAVRDAVRDAVDGAVGGAVRGAVGDAVDGAVDGAVGDAVGDAVGGAVRDAVSGAVGDAVRDAVRDTVDGAVRGAVDGAVLDAVGDAVRDAVRGAVSDAVDGAVGGAVGGAVRDAGFIQAAIRIVKKLNLNITWHYWLGGQFWVGWGWRGVAYIDFFLTVCGLKLEKDKMDRAEAYRKVCESVNYIWPNRDFVMVCERPKEIHRNVQNRLHNESGMSIKYPDGWGMYHLNGVRMTQEDVMTPKEKMTAEYVLKEKNAQCRAELVRKLGIERMRAAGKLVEKSGDYELIDMSTLFSRAKYAPYLFMLNPSVPGLYHMEGVGSECQSVQEALNWRRYRDVKKTWEPSVLT